jgi:hypothetical protein
VARSEKTQNPESRETGIYSTQQKQKKTITITITITITAEYSTTMGGSS